MLRSSDTVMGHKSQIIEMVDLLDSVIVLEWMNLEKNVF